MNLFRRISGCLTNGYFEYDEDVDTINFIMDKTELPLEKLDIIEQ